MLNQEHTLAPTVPHLHMPGKNIVYTLAAQSCFMMA